MSSHHKEGKKKKRWDFPDDAVDKNLLTSAGDTGSIPGLGKVHMPWSN